MLFTRWTGDTSAPRRCGRCAVIASMTHVGNSSQQMPQPAIWDLINALECELIALISSDSRVH